MHGNYYVSPQICDRVRKVVNDLGYLPDSGAAALKSKTRYMIGYLVSDISNHQFTIISRTIENAIEGEGYSLVVCSNNSQKQRELDCLKALLSQRIDGLIINTSGQNDEYITEISEYLPMVLLYRRINTERFKGDFVGSDNHAGGAMLAETLVAKGHHSIGVISGDTGINTFAERMQGFIQRLSQSNVKILKKHIKYGDYTEDGGYAMAEELLDGKHSITALCVLNNAMAAGAYEYIRAKNIGIPNDISVVSFGDIRNEKLFFVRPTFVSQYPHVVGNRAAELLLSRIKSPALAPREEIVPVCLIPGASESFASRAECVDDGSPAHLTFSQAADNNN
ncbi:MAG: LacI family transcriptional regulator [Treponema sp.]|nr:LacI family transcriptional regulator [Treponema sp.]